MRGHSFSWVCFLFMSSVHPYCLTFSCKLYLGSLIYQRGSQRTHTHQPVAPALQEMTQQVLHLVAPAPSGSLARFWPEVLPRPIPCSSSYATGKIFTCFWLTNELIQLFPQKSGVKRSKGAGTTPLMSQKLMCISLIHFVIIKERPDSQICRLDGYGVGLGITSGQNLASEPLGAGATRWSTCWAWTFIIFALWM